MAEQQKQPQMDLDELVKKIAISEEQHRAIVQDPKAMTHMFLDLISAAVYTTWKEVDKWVQARASEIVPVALAAFIKRVKHPQLEGKEKELILQLIEVGKESPYMDFIEMIDLAIKRVLAEEQKDG